MRSLSKYLEVLQYFETKCLCEHKGLSRLLVQSNVSGFKDTVHLALETCIFQRLEGACYVGLILFD